jgi:hypothetical protein
MSFAGSPKKHFMTFINYIKYLSIDTTLIAAACETETLFKDFMPLSVLFSQSMPKHRCGKELVGPRKSTK